MKVSKLKAGPFIHKFEVNGNKYIYDVNTMHIVHVDHVVWDIINDVGKLKQQEIIAKYRGCWEINEIRSAYKEILEAKRQHNLFITTRPEVGFHMSEDDLKAQYVKNRDQLILNVTERCNFACSYCANNQRNRTMRTAHADMSWEVAKKAIDQFLLDASPEHEHTAITFYGGEPLLNFPLIKQCVNYVRQMDEGKDIYLGVTTNGSLLSDEIVDFLVSQWVSITVSLDGPRELHDRYRKTKIGEPTWNTIVDNLKRYLKRHKSHYEIGKFGLSIVMAPPMEIKQLQDFSTSFFMGFPHITSLNFMARVSGFDPGGQIKDLGTLYQDFVEKLRTGIINREGDDMKYRIQRMLFEQKFLFLHRRHELYGYCENCGGIVFGEKYFSSSSCIPGTRRTFVNADGDLWPCERIRHTEYLKIGNVNQGFDIAKIWQMLADYVDMNKDECQNCWCLHGCQVGCLTEIGFGEKPTRKLKLEACRRYRKKSHDDLVEYCSMLEQNPHALDYMEEVTIS